MMRTFCGCISTKTGTIGILVFYGLLYLAGIVMAALTISQLSQMVDPTLNLAQSCGLNSTGMNISTMSSSSSTPTTTPASTSSIGNTTNMDSLSLMISWWCTFGLYVAVVVMYYGTYVAIGILVLRSILLILTIIAIYGAAKDRACPMLPSIIAEFIIWLKFVAIIVGCIFLIVVIGGVDITTIIFMAAIGIFFLAFLLYLWLCMVGHYQTLREIAKMDQLDKIHILQDDPRFHHEYQGGAVTPPPEYATANPAGYNELDAIPDMDAKLT